jgi:hypothetical protein
MVDLLWASTSRTHGHRHRGGGLQAPCTQGRTTPSWHLSLKVEKLNFTAEENFEDLGQHHILNEKTLFLLIGTNEPQ